MQPQYTTNPPSCDNLPDGRETAAVRNCTQKKTAVRRADGRIVGELCGDILSKHARREHMLRTPPAWAWDSAILEAAEKAGAQFTEIECDGLVYRASLSDFRRYPIPVNRGYGTQIGLALTYWHIRRVGEPPVAVQMSLFEVG